MPLDALRKAEQALQEHSQIIAEFEAQELDHARVTFQALFYGLCFALLMLGIPFVMMIAGGGR